MKVVFEFNFNESKMRASIDGDDVLEAINFDKVSKQYTIIIDEKTTTTELRSELDAFKKDIIIIRNEMKELKSTMKSELGMITRIIQQMRDESYKERALASSSSENMAPKGHLSAVTPVVEHAPVQSLENSCYIIEAPNVHVKNVPTKKKLILNTPLMFEKTKHAVRTSSTSDGISILVENMKKKRQRMLSSRIKGSSILCSLKVSNSKKLIQRTKDLSPNVRVQPKLTAYEIDLINEFKGLKEDGNALIPGTMVAVTRKELLDLLDKEEEVGDMVVDEFCTLLKMKALGSPDIYLKCFFFSPWSHELLLLPDNVQVMNSVIIQGIDNLWNSKLVFIPICKLGHWILLVVNVQRKEFQIYDSLKGHNALKRSLALHINKVIESLKGLFQKIYWVDPISWPTRQIKRHPTQSNRRVFIFLIVLALNFQRLLFRRNITNFNILYSKSCGVFVMKYMECLALDVGFNFDQDQIQFHRDSIAAMILEESRHGISKTNG